MELAVSVRDVHKSLGGHAVLAGVSFDVKVGEIVAVLGPSGTGKTVMLKHLVGLIRPDRGSVHVWGQDISSLRHKPLASLRGRIGFLSQGGALFQSQSVFDNVAFPLREKTKLDEDSIEQTVLDQLRVLGLAGSESKFPSELSGGMSRRVALARALVQQPEMLLFDEPTAGLDPVTSRSILELVMEKHSQQGLTMIVVTHNVSDFVPLVDRVVVLHGGVDRFRGTPQELLDSRDEFIREFLDSPQRPRAGSDGWQTSMSKDDS